MDMEDQEEEEKEMAEEEERKEQRQEILKILLTVNEEVLRVLNKHIVTLSNQSIPRSLTRRPVNSRGYEYIHGVLNEDLEHFRKLYRMYPQVSLKLSKIIREKTTLKYTRYICIEEMLATFLLVVGQNSRYSHIGETFNRSHFSTSQNFNKILKVLNKIAVDFMVKPGSSTPEKIRESTRFFPYFKDCIGAIDGTHIPAMVPGHDISSYRNRHGTISQNVLAACNFDLQFIYVLSGKYYLVDCGFPNRLQFLAPFRGVRYHLQDFHGQGRHPENAKELFNLRHASLRNTVERLFGIFKSRFTIFKTAPPFSFQTQAEPVLACAGLHNFLRKECRSDEFPVEADSETSATNQEEYFEPLIHETQEQQRENADAWRNDFAHEMWMNVEDRRS
ncbi:uncharacterized protein LOC141674864 [Apium graveolens]|uniref:uncharacterized protein LOC141674864 n=1 Tax=Apium graveolens TaxID=4045 RepID=UPI003D79B85D